MKYNNIVFNNIKIYSMIEFENIKIQIENIINDVAKLSVYNSFFIFAGIPPTVGTKEHVYAP